MLTVRDNPSATFWNRDAGYRSHANLSVVYPYRVFGSGVFDALTVRLGIIIELAAKIDGAKVPPGFSFFVHAPDELPSFEKNVLLIPSEHDAYISIRPEIVTTSNGLRSYLPHARGCYFESERQLRFFRSYSQQKCGRECMTNFTTKQCGCTHFALPSKCPSAPTIRSIVNSFN